jgi:hypothetical protein
MNRHPPLRALIRSIITEAPLDYWGSLPAADGPRTVGHVSPAEEPALRQLFDKLGHTYSIQVATNPQRALEALKPLFKNKTLESLDRPNGIWIIRSPQPSLQDIPPLSPLMRRYNPENIHILSLRPIGPSHYSSPMWTLHDLIGHPLETQISRTHPSIEKDGTLQNKLIRPWVARNSPPQLMVDLDLLPQLAALLLVLPPPPTPSPLRDLLIALKESLDLLLDSWRGSIIVVGPLPK